MNAPSVQVDNKFVFLTRTIKMELVTNPEVVRAIDENGFYPLTVSLPPNTTIIDAAYNPRSKAMRIEMLAPKMTDADALVERTLGVTREGCPFDGSKLTYRASLGYSLFLIEELKDGWS